MTGDRGMARWVSGWAGGNLTLAMAGRPADLTAPFGTWARVIRADSPERTTVTTTVDDGLSAPIHDTTLVEPGRLTHTRVWTDGRAPTTTRTYLWSLEEGLVAE